MRARSIKPGLYKNEVLAECSIMARYIVPGLWMLADREGRLEDRPKKIKAELLPYDDANMDALLNELQAAGHILRYRANDNDYIQILKFTSHQSPHVREMPSTIPAPGENGPSTTKAVPRHDLGSVEASPRSPSSLNPSSLNPERERAHDAPASPPPSEEILEDELEIQTGAIPEGWQLPESWGEWAETKGLSPASILHEAEKFVINYRALDGPTRGNWRNMWEKWVMRAIDYEKGKENGGLRRKAIAS